MHEINLPAHWKTARLGDATEIVKGGTPSRSVEKYFQGDIAWAIPSDITALDSALYISDTASHISEEGLGKSAAKMLPVGTVLLTSRATIGETAITTVPMATNQGFANFICKEVLFNSYLAYYLRHIRKKLNVLASGSTFKEVTKGTLLNVEILLPPLSEQRAIAHILQTIQEAKFTRQREIALERERKAALMEYLFSHGTKGEPRKQTEIGEIPESWEVVRLKEIANLRRENVQPKDSQGLNFVGLEHIDSGESNLKRWGNASEMKSAKTRFYPDDVLYGKLRSYLDKAIIAEMEGICSTDILVFTANSKTVSRFLVYLLHCHAFINHALSTSTGVSHPRTSWNSLEKFIFALPPLPEQRAIANVFQAIDEKTAALEKEAEHIDELFHAMLEELMTGQRSAVALIDAEMNV